MFMGKPFGGLTDHLVPLKSEMVGDGGLSKNQVISGGLCLKAQEMLLYSPIAGQLFPS